MTDSDTIDFDINNLDYNSDNFDNNKSYEEYSDKYNSSDKQRNHSNNHKDKHIRDEDNEYENNKSEKKQKKNKRKSKSEKDLEIELDTDRDFDWETNNKNYGYPKTDDPNFQSKIYSKREFYYYRLPDRPNLSSYKDIEEFRRKICVPSGQLLEHQALLSNFINPDTPYRGLLIFHGTGTGKTCAAIAVGEKFKQQVQRYGTQVYILVPGPLLKESWREHFIKCTGDTYLRQNENLIYLNDEEREKIKRQAVQNALQYYKVMSYRSFYRRVLGEKIIEKKVIEGNKIKVSYKKTEEGDFERDISMDRLHHLNNSLIIIDEAHNLTGNAYGEALTKIIKSSINLKVLLLTATPMKNLADDIVELLNFLRPQDSQIERDMIFTSAKNHTMELKPGGLDYLKKMANGYISHLRGADPMTFAEKVEMGEKPKGLYFTKISRCTMDEFQMDAYKKAKELAIEEADALDRKSEAVANFVFPGLDDDRKKLIGLYGREGLNTLKNQLKNHYEKINKMIGTDILKIAKPNEEFININETTKNITGAILKKEYLKYFSTKFYQALCDIEDNLFSSNGKGESRTGFVYSNLVKIGIEIFQEILIQNGFLEYDENSNNYQVKDNTVCYHCGKPNKDHKENDSHKFYPATFMVVTGQSSEETAEAIPENNKKIITNVFNNIENKEGKLIKLVLGSKVMNEGISLANVATVQILDVYFNFGRVDQVIGRAIRWCSHYKLMSEDNPYPKVKVYKYAVCMGKNSNELSTEEDLYFKAEQKYLLIKKVERTLKEVAIDCALNQSGNMFKEEIKDYDKCIKPNDKLLEIDIKPGEKNGPNICPSMCDFTDCVYKCHDSVLNSKYYDPNNGLYIKLNKLQLDYSTFTSNLARTEIEYAKKKIKELYMTNYVYNLKTIVDYVKDSYNTDKKDLFNDFFVQKGLDELIPVTENDFNNFKDIIYDKTYRPGYLIYLDGYYLFQPFDENENAPMYYRTTYQHNYQSKLSLYNYLLNEKYEVESEYGTVSDEDIEDTYYNFDEVMDYYDNRKEFKFVGIVDKETNRRKSKRVEEIKDVFKIREKREKILEKKRGTGIPSLKGAVCATSKQKEYLEELAKDVGIKMSSKDLTREDICNNIMNKLIELEKYATGNKKMTYIMVPKNHPKLKFPLNLEDRVQYLKNEVTKLLSTSIKFNEKIKDKKIELSFKLNSKPNRDELNKLDSMEFESKDKLKWEIIID